MKKLVRIRKGRYLAGVCGGIAKFFDMDPKIIRLLFVLFTLAYSSGLIAYIIFMIVMPKETK